jgi:hypothetical protein
VPFGQILNAFGEILAAKGIYNAAKSAKIRKEEKKENDTNGKYPYEAWYDV